MSQMIQVQAGATVLQMQAGAAEHQLCGCLVPLRGPAMLIKSLTCMFCPCLCQVAVHKHAGACSLQNPLLLLPTDEAPALCTTKLGRTQSTSQILHFGPVWTPCLHC